MGFIGRPGLPNALRSLLWECGKGKTGEAVCTPWDGRRCGRRRVNGARPSRALLGRLGRAGRQEDRASNKARSVSLIPPSIPPSVTLEGRRRQHPADMVHPGPAGAHPGPARAQGWDGGDGCSLSRGIQGSGVPQALGHGPIWARAAFPSPAVPLPVPLPGVPRDSGQNTVHATSVTPNPGEKEWLEKPIHPRQGLGGHRLTLGMLALISHCQAAPSPGVSGHGPSRAAGCGGSLRTAVGRRSGAPCPCPRPRPPAAPGHPSAAWGAHRGWRHRGRGRAVACGDVAPQGCSPAKATNPTPPDPPVAAGCGGAGGTHMSQERRGTRRGAKAGLARCIPFVPLPWTGASGEFVQALGSAHPGSLHGNAGAM